VNETLAIIRQAIRKEGMSHTWVFEWRIPNSLRLKRMKGKVKSKLIMGSVHKEFVVAGQTVGSAC
jgi:hypothetical protein